MTHVSLFAGIGGMDIAAEMAGFKTTAVCEIDPGCRKVLARHFPNAKQFSDIREITAETFYEAMKQSDKYKEAVSLYESGHSVAGVADAFGVTRQAMWKILVRRGCKMRPRCPQGKANHFFRGGPSSIESANDALERAVERGNLIRPEDCELCGCTPSRMRDGRTSIQAHHDDYSKPYEVTWLCQKCHYELHKNQYLAMKEVPQEVRPTLVSAGFP